MFSRWTNPVVTWPTGEVQRLKPVLFFDESVFFMPKFNPFLFFMFGLSHLKQQIINYETSFWFYGKQVMKIYGFGLKSMKETGFQRNSESSCFSSGILNQ